MKRTVISGLILVSLLSLSSAAWATIPLQHMLVYWRGNNLDTATTDAGISIINQAAPLGYNGIVCDDWRYDWYTNDSYTKQTFLSNATRLHAAALAKKMTYTTTFAGVGYSGSILYGCNRNLDEGFPVHDVPMSVQNGQLLPVDDPTNGDLATSFVSDFNADAGSLPGRPAGWSVMDGWGAMGFLDTPGRDGTGKCLKICNVNWNNGRCRLLRVFNNLQPYRGYHVKFWVKTSSCTFANSFSCDVTSATTGQMLQPSAVVSYSNGQGIAADQGWTQYDLTFNTLDSTAVNFYIGVSYGGSGGVNNILWVDDLTVEPVGFSRPIRRPGMMPKVTSMDGKTIYKEVRDYSQIGYGDVGSFYPSAEAVYYPPQLVTVPTTIMTCKLHNGDLVKVSYHHMMVLDGGQCTVCLNEPSLLDIFAKTAKNISTDIGPEGYMMAHDEIRFGGWDDSCMRSGKTQGQLLADNLRRSTSILRKAVTPSTPGNGFRLPLLFVWSDMFDKYQNAPTTGKYYMVKGDGPWQNSWKGLSPDVMVVNWNADSVNSQKWFSGNSNVGTDKTQQPVPCKQILSLSGDSPSSVTAPLTAAQTITNPDGSFGVVGVMYTTWTATYTNLAAFATNVAVQCTLPPKLP